MNKIERLIQELCPNGVEWKEVGDVTQIKKGKQLNKSLLTDDGTYPAYNGGQFESGRTDRYNVDENTTIISQGGASAGFVNFITTKFWANAHCYFLLPDKKIINNKYLYHFIKMKQNNLMESQYGSGIPALKVDSISKIKIPIPPLEIQEEIVKILDKFTDYVTELTTELTLRQKQYHYYRDKLLSFENEDIEWMLMPEVAKDFGRGKSKHRPRNDSKLYGGTIPFVQTGDIRNSKGHITDYSQTYSDFGLKQSKIWGKGTLCITIAANIAEMGILDFDACFPDSVVGFIANEEIVMTKFVAYYLESIKEVLASKSTGSAQENLNLASFSNLKIPVPSLERQLTIVKFLDNFDTICNDIYQGLPKEIELRQKQYEYYRDKLLTFD